MRDIKPQGRDLNWKFKVDFPPDFLSLEMKFGIPDENPFEYSLKLSFGLVFFFFLIATILIVMEPGHCSLEKFFNA